MKTYRRCQSARDRQTPSCDQYQAEAREMNKVKEGWCAIGSQCDRFRIIPQENCPDPSQEADECSVQCEKDGCHNSGNR